jgi:hypothetical protein
MGADMLVDLSHRVAPSSETLFREFDGGAVLLQLETEIYFGLDEIGTRMWNAAISAASLREAINALACEYDIEREVLERDFVQFITSLAEKKLLRLA